MDMEQVLTRALAQGNSTGQIALAEFILKGYKDEISPKLITFLERILQKEYENLGINLGKPGEDVALVVHKALENHG